MNEKIENAENTAQIKNECECDESQCTESEIYEWTIQTLLDSGCEQNQIQEFFDAKDDKSRLALLRIYRAKLLEKLHENQKKLSCLDYLICKIRKKIN